MVVIKFEDGSNSIMTFEQFEKMKYQSEEFECLSMVLNEKKVPSEDENGNSFSLVGRVNKYLEMNTLKNETPKQVKWRRYRFKTNSVDDYRPLVFNPKYPWWCSGFNDESATIIAYLPENDDAFNVTFEVMDIIVFSDRFPKPDYFVE